MDKVTEVKTQYNKEQWLGIIKERQDSGLTVKAWCRQNNIRQSAYYYWLRRIRESACSKYLPETQSGLQSPVIFAPVQINEEEIPSRASVIIHMKNADIEVRDDSSVKALETALAALKNIC